MTKITSLSPRQKLRQLAKQQLGQDFIKPLTSSTPTLSQDDAVRLSKAAQQGASAQDVSQSEAEQQALLKRAIQRQQLQACRQQQNLEQVLLLAQEFMQEQASTEDVDPDWFQQYCEFVQNISTLPMQKLWSRILACEIRRPGSFSIKTLTILKNMHYKDARTLQNAASLAGKFNGLQPEQILIGYSEYPSLWRWLRGKHRGMLNLSQFDLTYPQILNLVELGLLHQNEIESGRLERGQAFQWQAGTKSINGTIRRGDLVLHYYKFTAAGSELLSLLNTVVNPSYGVAVETLFADLIEPAL